MSNYSKGAKPPNQRLQNFQPKIRAWAMLLPDGDQVQKSED